MKMCRTILPCILLLFDLGDVMAVEENIIEATVPDTTGKTTVAPVTEATVPETMGETTVAIVHKDNNLVNLPLGPEKEQQLSGLDLGDVMAVEENITEATIPDTTGKTTVAPVTEATVPETMGETTEVIVHKDNNLVNLPLGPEKEQQLSGLDLGDVMAVEENIIEATIPDTTGKTTVAPVTEATVPETMGETTEVIVHKDNNLVNLPLGPEKEQQLSGLDLGDVMAVEENIIEATIPDTTGKTTVAPVTEATVPETMGETTEVIVHKDNNLVNLPLGPEKEQQLSGLVIGLSISFGILLICGVIIYCCIWKKSRVGRRNESTLT
ncbi:uncharacterized protein LOC125635374 isoform X2 [Caretta caretta]|uniref:uncharacterized protein LOC125635374 isoform X2 n=1 Tax=Caretta caretta TaxID=8467 RepID=UPI003F4B2E27